MNDNKKMNTVSFQIRYLTIDNTKKTTHTVNDIDECDFALIRKSEFESKNVDHNKFVQGIRNNLMKQCPENDWRYKTSRIGNHCFWKRSDSFENKKTKAPKWGKQERIEYAKAEA